MFLRRLLLLSGLVIAFNCSSGNGSDNDPGQTNSAALSVGDSFSGFSDLNICANEDIGYDHGDTSTVILLSLFASW